MIMKLKLPDLRGIISGLRHVSVEMREVEVFPGKKENVPVARNIDPVLSTYIGVNIAEIEPITQQAAKDETTILKEHLVEDPDNAGKVLVVDGKQVFQEGKDLAMLAGALEKMNKAEFDVNIQRFSLSLMKDLGIPVAPIVMAQLKPLFTEFAD